MSTRRLILLVLLGLIGLGMLTGIAAVLLPRNTLPEELLITITIAGLYAMGLLVVFSAGPRMVRTRWVALVGAAISFLGYMIMLWFDNAMRWETRDLIIQWSTVALILAFAMTQRLMLVPLRPRVLVGRVAQRAGLIAGAVTALMLAGILVLEDFIWFEELYTRMLGIAAIVAAGGTIGTGIVWFFERKPEHEDPGVLGEGVPVRLTCPRCAGPIEARSNREARCDGCRLRVRVEVDEPRCVCGYLLYQLTGDTCPECGKSVPEAERWAAPV